ncbi:hypothetical protein JW977_02875 [Candidatus Falkowbacteria bacterium]|nr:hypothetical protein [Candidatus Falkowbacteria bacterium]
MGLVLDQALFLLEIFGYNLFMAEQYFKITTWLKRGTLAVIGFLLSPLSWWNDIFINFPLAYGFAYAVGRIIHIFILIPRWFFIILFIVGYFLTNLLGFLMIHYSITGKSEEKETLWKQALITLIYTVLIIILAYFDVFKINLNFTILPSWVIK